MRALFMSENRTNGCSVNAILSGRMGNNPGELLDRVCAQSPIVTHERSVSGQKPVEEECIVCGNSTDNGGRLRTLAERRGAGVSMAEAKRKLCCARALSAFS